MEGSVEVITGLKGQTNLCLGGYIYSKQKIGAKSIRWRCANRGSFKCSGAVTTSRDIPGAGEEESSRLTDEPDETDPIAATVKQQLSDFSVSASDVAEAAVGGNASSKDGSVSGKRKQISQQSEGSKRLKPDESDRPMFPYDSDSWGFDDDSESRRDGEDGFNGTTDFENHRPVNETRITTENADEYTIFGHYIACKLRKLNDTRLLATAQNQITNYLFQLEMGNLDAKLESS